MSFPNSPEKAVDLILAQDPAAAYAAMDEATRERYRRACAQVAEGSAHPADAVAREALRLSTEHDAHEPRGRHVGFWLLAEGRARLEARLGIRAPGRVRAVRFLRRHAQGVYVGSMLALTGLALLGAHRLLTVYGLSTTLRMPLLVLLAPSLLDFVEESVTLLLSLVLPELAPLPRMEPGGVFSPDTRTMVVTPLLVTSAEDIESQLRMLEINYLGNLEPELFFALLTDFRDAPEQHLPADQELRERLERGLRELNARHGHADAPRFLCLHRERRWNAVAGRWMGWERKRGKLEEFNRLVLGARDTSYTGPVPELVHSVRYVLTLDADTHLLPGDAARLVATLHHPLNRPRLDASGRRVVAGYAMLQPAIANDPSREMWLASGGWPLSLVRAKKDARQVMDLMSLHQRLFGIGYFMGKGLYDVAAFTHGLEGRFPENTILSHDKLEGMYTRVAYTHDVTLFEGSAMTMTSQARIWHRWTRGDWQVLPWLFSRVPAQDGRRQPNDLSLIDRWHLLLSMRVSLLYPLTLALLAYGWLGLPARVAGAWTLGGLLWNRRNQFTHTVVYLGRAVRSATSWVGRLRAVASLVPRVLGAVILGVVLIVPATTLLLDAIGRALYGLAFDRSRMLEWTTHAQSARQAKGVRALLALPEGGGALGLALALAGALALFNPGALPWACPLLLAWMLIPVVSAREGRPAQAPAEPPHFGQLRALARGAWELYAQRAPTGGELRRGPLPEGGEETLSPTDVALELMAPMSGYHLGYLDREGLVSRLGEALTALEGLEHSRGHPLARYSVRERAPVSPRRIGTAHSGTLAAALLVVERGLQAARGAVTEPGLRERLEQVEARARARREALDFAWLYDERAGRMHTGYDVEAQALEAGHHEGLTSGAMLASFVAIASRQVPLRHWAVLIAAEERTRAEGAEGARPREREALAEQLLPTLFVWFPPATLLGAAARDTLEAERSALDPAHLAMLAMRFQPERAVAELQRVARAEPGEPRAPALALAAVANLTCDDILVRHFHQHWRTAWVEALVYETKDTL